MGYGGQYGQQYGQDLGPQGGPAVFEFTSNETVTAVDTLPEHFVNRFRNNSEIVTAVDGHQISPTTYVRQVDEQVTAVDGVDESSLETKGDKPTTGAAGLTIYEPLVDLNMVEARLTNRARYYIARGMHDGTALHPLRYELGAGWENPRWGEPPKPSPDATEVENLVYEGSLSDDRMRLEEANASSLVIRCAGPEAPAYNPTELMVYAEIRNSPVEGETFKQIPFANATFPIWFHTTGQQFIARIVLPLGMGQRFELYVRDPITVINSEVTAVDTVTVVVA